nr:glycosyl hydrolase family 28-related protein [Actinoplanes sp. RD1]
MRLSFPAVVAALVSLPAALVALAAPASAATAAAAPAYSLASAVSPAPLAAADCASDATCFAAPAPKGGTADDYAVLAALITKAAAVAPATVALQEGTYQLSKGLRLPPNVSLRGAGIAKTVLLADPTSNWKNWSYSFIVRPTDDKVAGSSNLVSDLTVNGNCRTGAGDFDDATMPGRPGELCDFRTTLGASTNTAGGISAGDRWTVRQVRFTNLEYFKLWINYATGVRIVDNRWDNRGGAESGDEDNIGGGGRNDGTVIENNQFDATINGNSFDFTNAIRTVVRGNIVRTTPAVAKARGVDEYGNMYFEGVVGGTVSGNTLEGSHIVLKSNAGYAHTGNNKDVTNPRDMVVTGNTILDSHTVGVAVAYDDYTDADGTTGTLGGWDDFSSVDTDHVVRAGGNNVVRDNVIERSGETGIIVYGMTGTKNAADTITGNRIVDAGFGGSTAYSTGAGYFDTSGIGLSVGAKDVISGNTIIDDQAHPTTWYGVQLGVRKGSAKPTYTTVTGNTTSGVIGSAVRTAANAPETPGNLTAAGDTITWDETYASGNAVAGYKIYNNGLPVATLPVGSTEIPGNLLDADASGLENTAAGLAGWTAGGSGTKVARSTAAGANSGASLQLTAATAGQISTYSRKVTPVAGQTYTSVASFQAGSTARRVRAGLAFTDSSGKVTRLASSNASTVDATTGWMTSAFSAAAPAGAVSVQAFVMVENTVVGESHLLDRLGLVAGTATEQFTVPAGLTGTYQVVAYRTDTAENSAAATVTAP